MNDDLLNFAVQQGNIDMQQLQDKFEAMKNQKYLEKHEYRIWQGPSGDWFTYLPPTKEGGKKKLVKKTKKENVEKAVIEFYRSQEEDPTIDEIFELANDRKYNLHEIGDITYRTNRSLYKRFFKDFGKKRLSKVSQTDWADFLDDCAAKYNLTVKGLVGLKNLVKYVLKYAYRKKWVSYLPEQVFASMETSTKSLRHIIKPDEKEVFNEDETDLMMSYLEEHTEDQRYLGLLLLFVTGMRVGELAALEKEDISDCVVSVHRTESVRFNPDTGKYQVVVKDFPKTKAGCRDIIVPKEYEWLLQKIKSNNPDDIFCFMKNGKRIRALSFRSALTTLCKHLGIVRKTPHKIRKTYGTILLDNHLDRLTILQQMGHTDLLTTEGYYHRNRRKLEERQEELSAIPDFSKNY